MKIVILCLLYSWYAFAENRVKVRFFSDDRCERDIRAMMALSEDRWGDQAAISPQACVWGKVILRADESGLYYLETESALTHGMVIFLPQTEQRVDSVQFTPGGRTRRDLYPHWNYVVSMWLVRGTENPVYIRYGNPRQIHVPLRFWPQQAFLSGTRQFALEHGFFIGIFLGWALLIFLSYLSFREKVYLYYIYVIFSFVLFTLFYSGFGFRFLIPYDYARMLAFTPYLAVVLLIFSLLAFTRIYFNTANDLKTWDKYTRLVMWALVALMLSIPVYPVTLLTLLIPWLAILASLWVMGLGIFFWKQHAGARWFVIGMALPIFVGILLALQIIGYVPVNWDVSGYLYGSFMFNVLIIGSGLGRRLGILHREKTDLQKQVLDYLTRADQLKDEFLANTSHELKTPLNGIVGIAEAMLDDRHAQIPVHVRRNLRLIVNCGMRLSNLINDILDYAHLKQGDIALQIQPVSLWRSVEMVLRVLHPIARRKGIELRQGVAENFTPVLADQDRLQQILTNLVGNAIKFTDKGFVEVLSRKISDEFAEIEVRDTGIGIAPQDHERIFEMFRQVDSVISGRGSMGTGIGLSLTRKLVQMHGGQIRVESSPGRGARFIFTLPIAQNMAPEIADTGQIPAIDETPADFLRIAEPVGGAVSGGRILVVDDEIVNLQVLVNQLTLEGFRVDTAENGSAALRKMEINGPPDLVLLDLMMPEISGFDVCLHIRREYDAAKLPIIILTARNQPADLVKGLEWGANDFLIKPFSKAELLSRIRTHLNLSRLHRTYARFVPQEFLEQMGKSSIADVQLGDQTERHMAVFVADIRRFTSLAETMYPGELFDFLNRHLEQMLPIIRMYGGIVARFVGDAVIALFPGGPDQALSAALDLHQILKRARLYHPRTGSPVFVEMGISVHIGRLVLGTVGFEGRMDVTVVSDKIRQAFALENYNRLLGSFAIISGDVWSLCDQARFSSRLLGRLRGEDGSVLEYRELLTGDYPVSRSRFEEAVELMYGGNAGEATRLFEEICSEFPEDRVAARMREFCLHRNEVIAGKEEL